MNRIIKFRAWDKEENKMIKHSVIQFWSIRDLSTFEPSNFELMQFTGLKDKNGKEIYEGDIVKTTNGIKKIEWQSKPGRWAINLGEFYGELYFTDQLFEVIGNIYENPEILK